MTFSPADFLTRSVGAPKTALPWKTIAEHWGVSPSYVSQLRKAKDMPSFATLADADEWRSENCKFERAKSVPAAAKPQALDLSDLLTDTPEDFVGASIEQAQAVPPVAFRLYIQAAEAGNDSLVPMRIKNWGEASKQAAQVLEKYLAIQERTSQLLPLDIVLDVVETQLHAIVSPLDSLGRRIAKQVNPENPELAMQVIDEEIDRIKSKTLETKSRIESEISKQRERVAVKTEQ